MSGYGRPGGARRGDRGDSEWEASITNTTHALIVRLAKASRRPPNGLGCWRRIQIDRLGVRRQHWAMSEPEVDELLSTNLRSLGAAAERMIASEVPAKTHGARHRH